MAREKVHILDVPFDKVTMEVAVRRVASFLNTGTPHQVVTANPEGVMLARQDRELAQVIREADLVVADGIGVVVASRRRGKPLPERIPGIELAQELLSLAEAEGYRVYLLGGQAEVIKGAVRNLSIRYPALKIVGWQHGYFSPAEEEKIIADIQETAPHLLLVALGMPKQEKWIYRHKAQLGVPVLMGVGGSFDVFAGKVRRAPAWMCRLGLEWLYRFLSQPQRALRMLALPHFLWLVLRNYPRRRTGL